MTLCTKLRMHLIEWFFTDHKYNFKPNYGKYIIEEHISKNTILKTKFIFKLRILKSSNSNKYN